MERNKLRLMGRVGKGLEENTVNTKHIKSQIIKIKLIISKFV